MTSLYPIYKLLPMWRFHNLINCFINHFLILSIQICMNGLIRFGAPWYIHWPHTLGSSRQSYDNDLAMLAPYWSLVDRYDSFNLGISNVYYQVYDSSMNTLKSRNVLVRATSDVNRLNPQPLRTKFQASWVLVVTWSRLRHTNINSQTRDLVIIEKGQEYVHCLGKRDSANQNIPCEAISFPPLSDIFIISNVLILQLFLVQHFPSGHHH